MIEKSKHCRSKPFLPFFATITFQNNILKLIVKIDSLIVINNRSFETFDFSHFKATFNPFDRELFNPGKKSWLC